MVYKLFSKHRIIFLSPYKKNYVLLQTQIQRKSVLKITKKEKQNKLGII